MKIKIIQTAEDNYIIKRKRFFVLWDDIQIWSTIGGALEYIRTTFGLEAMLACQIVWKD